MDSPSSQKPSLKGLGSVSRKPIDLSRREAVKADHLKPGQPIPFVVEPLADRINLMAWARDNREFIDSLLLKHRALLFRGFDVNTVADFKNFATLTCNGGLLEYNDRSSPRHEVGDRVYVSTVYPAGRRINLHNEGSYWFAWVLKIYFCCLKAAEQGGETPIADVRRVFDRLSSSVKESFEQKGVMYVRNYNDGFGLTWQEAFQTGNRAEVEAYCQHNEIESEWKEGGRLRTRQVRPAVRQHPRTGEPVWFNHAAFFHISSREPEVREGLTEAFDEQDLPYMTFYGDGTPIEASAIEEIKEAYQQEKIIFTWRDGDVLLLDNMSIAHGRESYKGDRRIVVAMGEPYREDKQCGQ
jgi:alpha-ketoglutarate-dependent taurine dioxygenase